MILLNSFSISRLNNAEATAFYINVQKAIVEAEAEALGLAAGLVTNYNNTLKKLVDQVYVAQGSELTATMNAADVRRTQIMKRIRLRLQMVECCDDSAALLACKEKVQTHLLTKYTADVNKMAIQQKSAVITGFVNDLTTKLNEDDMEALGIESDISALTQANNAFISAYNARSAERAAGNTQVTAKLRSEMGEYYTIISLSVQLMANDDTEANASKATACQEFIGVVNVILADAKKRFLQRTGKISEEVKEEDENGGNTGSDSGDNTSGDNHNGATDIPDDVVFPGMD